VANNRLYLEDTATGERLLLAKSFGAGWTLWPTPSQLNEWLICRDEAAAYGPDQDTATTQLRLLTEYQEEAERCGVTLRDGPPSS
jgi:hypothetical protein